MFLFGITPFQLVGSKDPNNRSLYKFCYYSEATPHTPWGQLVHVVLYNVLSRLRTGPLYCWHVVPVDREAARATDREPDGEAISHTDSSSDVPYPNNFKGFAFIFLAIFTPFTNIVQFRDIYKSEIFSPHTSHLRQNISRFTNAKQVEMEA